MLPRFITRFVSRLFVWLRMLRAFKGLTLRSELNLLLFALYDVLFYTISGAALNPRLVLEGIFLFKIKGLGIAVVRGDADDLYLLPGREGDVDAFIKSRLREGVVFVDVGANVGYYTLVASKLVGATGHIYAIEPVPSTAVILMVNAKLNGCGNVIVRKVATWYTRGKLVLKISVSAYGYASVVREGTSVTVDASTLDDILRDEASIHLIKIDVEGAELEVLRVLKACSTGRATWFLSCREMLAKF
ncbi:MAG: FkbM family methyltransferase [Desulfurococcales archaeon]|jgi:FkbM family methyltransferase|nr:FkbM family methyltransferase [Desulfurococcales archaeon]